MSACWATCWRSFFESPANRGTDPSFLASTWHLLVEVGRELVPATLHRPMMPRNGEPRVARLADGGVPERTNGTASKAVRGLIHPSQVRILSPPQGSRPRCASVQRQAQARNEGVRGGGHR